MTYKKNPNNAQHHSQRQLRYRMIGAILDPPYFSLDTTFKNINLYVELREFKNLLILFYSMKYVRKVQFMTDRQLLSESCQLFYLQCTLSCVDELEDQLHVGRADATQYKQRVLVPSRPSR
jgi:hypothetical protein